MSMSTTARRTGAIASTALVTAALIGSLAVSPAAADQPADSGTPAPQANGQGHEGTGNTETGEAPGNRGTVKIHEVGTAEHDHRNEPQVCEFEIVGFGFADDANLEITIEGHGGPNSGSGSFSSTVSPDQLSDAGDWVVDGPTLPDGMYKLYVENTTAPGGAKQKVFKIDCPDDDVIIDDDDVIVDDDDDVIIDDDDDVIIDDDDDVIIDDDDVIIDDDDVIIDDEDVIIDGEATGGTQVLGAVLTRNVPAASPVAAVTPAPQAVRASALARTGAEVRQLVLAASALLLAGGVFVRLARRRALV